MVGSRLDRTARERARASKIIEMANGIRNCLDDGCDLSELEEPIERIEPDEPPVRKLRKAS